MNEYPEESSLFLFFVIIILVSGCVSPTSVNETSPATMTQQSTVAITPPYMGDQSLWIHIDPIEDFHSESPFNITGSTVLKISGTTNFPAGSLFFVNIIEEERSRSLPTNIVVPAEKNSNGSIGFSCSYDMKGNPPARYRVEIRKANQNFTAIAHFNITSQEPWWWITIDHFGEIQKRENLTITGTTNLPIGSEILVSSGLMAHPCTQPWDSGGLPSFCGGTCSGAVALTKTSVMGGAEGRNTWSCPINTTDWCAYEYYGIRVDSDWPNVTSESITINIGNNNR